MADTIVQVPPDSTGKKLHMRSRVRNAGADTVQQQGVFISQGDTWSACADAVAFAANKHHISIFNAAASGKCVTIHDIRFINLALTAVTGVGIRFEVKKITAASAGTVITPESWDTTQAALPAGVTVRTNGTITEGNLLFPFAVNNDEIPLTLSNHNFLGNSILPTLAHESAGGLVLREGQGLTVKQITTSVVGSFAWLIVFGVEETWT